MKIIILADEMSPKKPKKRVGLKLLMYEYVRVSTIALMVVFAFAVQQSVGEHPISVLDTFVLASCWQSTNPAEIFCAITRTIETSQLDLLHVLDRTISHSWSPLEVSLTFLAPPVSPITLRFQTYVGMYYWSNSTWWWLFGGFRYKFLIDF